MPLKQEKNRVDNFARVMSCNRQFLSCLLLLCQNEVAYNTIHLKMSSQVHFHVIQSHFNNKSFALGVVLKQRRKGNSKWPVIHRGSAK